MANPAPTKFASPRGPGRRFKDAAREGAVRVDTAVRSAADTITMGYADEAAAGADALFSGGVAGFRNRYEANLARERSRDEYDETHREVARLVGEAAATAILAARGGYLYGKNYSSKLIPEHKGHVGEALSKAKTMLKGDTPMHFRDRVKVSGGKTIPDHPTYRGKQVEAKFDKSTLSARQKEAVRELGDIYRVDWWRPHHVGMIAGGFAAPVGGAVPSIYRAWTDPDL